MLCVRPVSIARPVSELDAYCLLPRFLLACGPGVLMGSKLKSAGGYNGWGLLGDGTTTDSPTPVTANVGGAVELLATGNTHTCVVLVTGTLKCWGQNWWGEVGDGTTTNRLSPTTIDVGGTVQMLVAGGSHTCVYLVGDVLKCCA